MTGHEQLLAMRRSGRRPACVFVYDDDAPMCVQAVATWHQEPNPYTGRYHARLRLTTDDIPEALDLRCIVGLEVHMDCQRSPARARRLFDALVGAGARKVISVQGPEVWFHNKATEGAAHG